MRLGEMMDSMSNQEAQEAQAVEGGNEIDPVPEEELYPEIEYMPPKEGEWKFIYQTRDRLTGVHRSML